MEMPPVPLWYAGRANYGRFIDRVFRMRGTGWRMIRTGANGQPALAAYCPGDDARALRLHTLQVLTVTAEGISRNAVFADPAVFGVFGLSRVIEP
jgi:RNA polymerase sigma-70 factor, ECF subfamily